MSRISILVVSQAFLCWLEAYLISKISFIGRIGIATTHKEYKLLRSGWKTFLLFWSIQTAIIILLAIVAKKCSRKTALTIAYIFLATAVLGLLTTYMDFRDTYSHRLLNERFHLGFYLFWLGWMSTCIAFAVSIHNRKEQLSEAPPEQPSMPSMQAPLK